MLAPENSAEKFPLKRAKNPRLLPAVTVPGVPNYTTTMMQIY
jgi:hypothetical protein